MPRRTHLVGPTLLAAAVVATIAVAPASPWTRQARADRMLERVLVAPTSRVTTTAPTTTVPKPTTTVPPTTTTTAPPPPPPTTAPAPVPRFSLEPYRGLGAWLDVYDWSATFATYAPGVEPDAVDALAAQGVQTLFIQASKWDAPEDVLEVGRLLAFVDRAHQHGISVVGWYLPTLEDPARDVQRLLAIAALPIDGLAVDIESRKVGDVVERNRRLIQMSSALRAALPGEVIGAIPLEPVLLEDVNPHYWPAFPWPELSPSYDVWLPMIYWTNRSGNTPWRDAHTYTAANIIRVRAHLGRPDAPVHALGGIGDQTSVPDVQGFRAGAAEQHVIGASIYDFRTTAGPLWPELVPFRDLRPAP
jgi:hypothetical protein